MCGIVGYLGDKSAAPVLIKGLQRLEYRGYDSAGICIVNKDGFNTVKRKGVVSGIATEGINIDGYIGIGHTRWATHGVPSDENAHPHISGDNSIAVVHNGIIENYETLKTYLTNKGYVFKSATDTEVLAHLISDIRSSRRCSLEEAVRIALTKVEGAYAIAVLSRGCARKMVVAKNSSPLAIGITNNEYFVGSDASAIVEYTKEVVYLDDEEIAIITDDGVTVTNIKKDDIELNVQTLDLSLDQIERKGFDSFMLKEIFDQPKAIRDLLRGRVSSPTSLIKLGGIHKYLPAIDRAKKVTIVACGTSYHAGLVGKSIIEKLNRIPVDVCFASEFRYSDPIIQEGEIVIAISQSGETADTIAAVELAKHLGAITIGICNVVGSTIARITDCGCYMHVGPEVSVASTKAFTGQVAMLGLIFIDSAFRTSQINREKLFEYLYELDQIPVKIGKILEKTREIEAICEEYYDVTACSFIGRGIQYPVALEGSLKLKEISYIHAQGYPAAEMKHGHIALVDKNTPTIAVATNNSQLSKMVSNIEEVKARNGKVIAIANENNDLADKVIVIPETLDIFEPLLTVIPMQLIAYFIAKKRGCNVDRPRNLAKSVTVE